MFSVELYGRIRHACHVEGLSQREAARRFGIHRNTVRKMPCFAVPPGYRRTKPPLRPKLEAFNAIIDTILESDRSAPYNQRHTAKRIFERLRAEPGFAGSYTTVKAASIGSNQSLKSDTASSTSGCTASHFVVGLVMAWSPARRANTGFDWVGQSGDYATPNSNQPCDSTSALPTSFRDSWPSGVSFSASVTGWWSLSSFGSMRIPDGPIRGDTRNSTSMSPLSMSLRRMMIGH